MTRTHIHTGDAPAPIGPYSQAMRFGSFLFLSGQIALDPRTQEMVSGSVTDESVQVFHNLEAVAKAANLSLREHLLKLTVYLTDLSDFETVNSVMQERLGEPYPARAVVGVAALPRGARVEIEAIMVGP